MSISTWNDLRVESVFALLSGFVGLVGVILTLKPVSLKINRRMTLILAICGMVISCEFSTYLLLDFSLTVKVAPHECEIRTSQP